MQKYPLVSRCREQGGFLQKSTQIQSDVDNKGGIFSAYGNVKIIYKKNGIIATSQQAQYLKKENILVLKGDVDLIRKGRDSLHAQRLVYLLENDEIIADSDSESQVLLNFFLDSGNTNQQPSSLWVLF